MMDLPRGTILGSEEDSITGKPIDTEEAESFTKCPVCGGMIAIVMAHLKPLPHPRQNATN